MKNKSSAPFKADPEGRGIEPNEIITIITYYALTFPESLVYYRKEKSNFSDGITRSRRDGAFGRAVSPEGFGGF